MNHLPNKFQSLFKQNPALVDYLQRSALDGIWYWKITTPKDKWITPTFWATLGYTVNDNQMYSGNIVHPEDAKEWSDFTQVHSFEKNNQKQNTFHFLNKDGRTVWMQCRKGFFNEKEDDYVLITFRNVTKFKEKEKLLLDTNRHAKIGAWELNLSTNQLYWSTITRAIHEVPSDFQPKLEEGINFYKEGYSRKTITRCIQEALKQGKPWNVDLQILTYTGKEVWVRAIGHAEFHRGKALRIYGSFQDIHEEKQMVEQLRQLSILEAKNKNIEQFAYIVSHDLREPLTSMKGYMQLLQEDFTSNLSADAQELLSATIETAERMDELIHDLLGYSREGKEKEKELVDITKILHQVLADLSIQIQRSQAIFKISQLPVVSAYPTEIKSIFQNLISNALKFRRPTIKLEIEISAKKLKNGWRFSVIDNGIGIPEGEVQKVFDVFHRLHGDEYNGTGIGLASCKKIVEHHEGRIWVESILGEGSHFYFTVLTN